MWLIFKGSEKNPEKIKGSEKILHFLGKMLQAGTWEKNMTDPLNFKDKKLEVFSALGMIIKPYFGPKSIQYPRNPEIQSSWTPIYIQDGTLM